MHRVAVTVLTVVALLSLSACSDLQAQMDGAELMTDDLPASARVPEVLATTEWAETEGLVSVVVRNDDDRTLTTAEATMTAYDAEGAVVGTYDTTTMAGDSACCTVLSLAPGEDFGLYFAVGPGAERIEEIALDYGRIAWAAAGEDDASTTGSAVAVPRATILDPDRTLVRAVVDVGGADLPRALVQAVLRGRSGKLIAVVTGRWSCLESGSRRAITMELFQPVPVGTSVDTVTVRPLDDQVEPRCR